jgi:hypothetical protein
MPVLAVAMCRPRAMSCELTCSQSSSLVAQNSRGREKINNENTIAGTSSGCEQALGHELCTHKLTHKFIDSSEFKWGERKLNLQKCTAGTGSGCEQAQGHELWAHKLKN